MSILMFTLITINSYLGLFMTNYTTSHTESNTLVSTQITKGGFSETIQFEFKRPISAYQIRKVFDGLTKHQQDALARHKTGFKQFIRAIMLAYPVERAPNNEKQLNPRADEAKRYISRISSHVDMSSSDAVRNYLTSGTVSKKKYDNMIGNHPDKVVVEDEKLVYIRMNGFTIVSGTDSILRAKGAKPLYIYAVFSTLPATKV